MSKKDKKYTLPKKFAEKWLKALRSDEYTQGRGRLHGIKENSYCCLGVACHLVHKKQLKNPLYAEAGSPDDTSEEGKPIFYKIPKNLREGRLVAELIDLNDVHLYNFEQIADWVEENVKLI